MGVSQHTQQRIGERELAEVAEQLRKAERQRDEILRIFRLVGAGAWAADFTGYVLTVDDTYLAITGQTREQALGEGWRDAIYPDDLAWVERTWAAALAARHILVASYRYKRRDTGGVIRVVTSAHCNSEGWCGTTTPIDGLQCPFMLPGRKCGILCGDDERD